MPTPLLFNILFTVSWGDLASSVYWLSVVVNLAIAALIVGLIVGNELIDLSLFKLVVLGAGVIFNESLVGVVACFVKLLAVLFNALHNAEEAIFWIGLGDWFCVYVPVNFLT